MKNIKSVSRALILISLFVSLSGCLFVDTRFPLDQNYDKTTLGNKEGSSEMQSFLWLVALGDAGTEAAARNGDIQVIHHADRAVYSVFFGMYSRVTTVVYGD